MVAHPNYDAYWKARNIRPHTRKLTSAVLTVGDFYDTEDLFGPWATYAAAERQSPGTGNTLVIGPWSHGGWGRGDGNTLGTLRWNTKTGTFSRDSVEFPSFPHWLKGAPASTTGIAMMPGRRGSTSGSFPPHGSSGGLPRTSARGRARLIAPASRPRLPSARRSRHRGRRRPARSSDPIGDSRRVDHSRHQRVPSG